MVQATPKGMIVIIIDADPEHLLLLEQLLQGPRAFQASGGIPRMIKTYTDPADALAEFPASGPVVVLCAHDLPGASGLEWLPDLTRQDLGPVILLCSDGDERVAVDAFHAGAADYLSKAEVFENPEIMGNAIRDALRRHKLAHRNQQLSKDLKIANTTLRNQNQRLAELTETAHRFVDNVAHEFRTPLTVIKEFTSIVADGLGGPVTDEQQKFLQFIDASTRDLAQMVDDFLDTSKLRAQQLRVSRQAFDVGELFSSTRPGIESRAKAKDVVIEERHESGLPAVFGDSEKASRALLNLVTNAIKFSPDRGKVVLETALTAAGDVVVRVTDHGPGLSADDIAIITERFQQLGNQRSAGKGFGLGLNIARDLIHLNLGELEVVSEVGLGSTFSFTLPHHDPEHIFRRYADMMVRAHADCNLSILRLRAQSGVPASREICEFLVSTCQSNDLILAAPSQRCVVLAGPSDSPDGWVKKLQDAWPQYVKAGGAPQDIGGIDINWLGTWNIPDHQDAVTQAVMDCLLEMRACA